MLVDPYGLDSLAKAQPLAELGGQPMDLFRKYRPRSLAEVVGQPAAVRQVETVLGQGGAGGKSWFISGPPGSGKSSIARIIAETLADDACIVELAGDELTVDRLEKIQHDFQWYGCLGSSKSGWAVIVNETHGLRANIVRLLLVILGDRPIPRHVVWIFTTTTEGKDLFGDKLDAGPFLSRTNEIRLTNQGLAAAFAAHVQRIATLEGLNGQPLERYVKLAHECRGNCRMMLQAVARGVMRE